jgi:hypothetical protein
MGFVNFLEEKLMPIMGKIAANKYINLNSASSKQIKNSISMNVKKTVFCYKFCTLITAYLH